MNRDDVKRALFMVMAIFVMTIRLVTQPGDLPPLHLLPEHAQDQLTSHIEHPPIQFQPFEGFQFVGSENSHAPCFDWQGYISGVFTVLDSSFPSENQRNQDIFCCILSRNSVDLNYPAHSFW